VNDPSAPLDWDYSALAAYYGLRAPYAQSALDELFARLALPTGSDCVDIGAGSGRLTAALVKQGLRTTAVEPNEHMRAIGQRDVAQARWLPTRGEATGLPPQCCALLTFGSSFNVLPPHAALDTAAYLLRPGGWLVCLWNHRDLDDPLQARLQAAIEQHVPSYAHGSRRNDPSAMMAADGRFGAVVRITGTLVHTTAARAFVEGFRAHATLVRQAGVLLPVVLDEMTVVLAGRERIDVPFITRIYAARRRTAP
jgi:SAM-dependent methyltransferase